jgi:MFS family permease
MRLVGQLCDNGILPSVGGLCALAVVMGIGRFAYTVLLPGMMYTHGFGEEMAGLMAAWNYAGYLIGVLAVRKETPGRRRYLLFVFFLILSLATTAGMGLARTAVLWHALRFFSGFASGACFVLCSSIVLDTLTAINRPVLAGLLYSGVGVGIALGGATAGSFEAADGSAGAWFGMAALCLPLAAIASITLRPEVNRAPLSFSSASGQTGTQKNSRQIIYLILLISYFLEGFGYIIGTTFLVTLVQAVTSSPEIARASWVVTGCAAALSAPLWRFAARRGYLPMLILAFLLQGGGMLLPAISSSSIAALSGGLLIGGTFMGITVLSLQYGVALSGKPSAHTVALMTALYGAGQIIGPFVAGMTARGQGFSFAFILAAFSLFIAAALLFTENFGQQRTMTPMRRKQ